MTDPRPGYVPKNPKGPRWQPPVPRSMGGGGNGRGGGGGGGRGYSQLRGMPSTFRGQFRQIAGMMPASTFNQQVPGAGGRGGAGMTLGDLLAMTMVTRGLPSSMGMNPEQWMAGGYNRYAQYLAMNQAGRQGNGGNGGDNGPDTFNPLQPKYGYDYLPKFYTSGRFIDLPWRTPGGGGGGVGLG